MFNVVSVPDGVVTSGDETDTYAFVATRTPYIDLLATAGFVDIEITDMTDAYLAVAGAWLNAVGDLEADLRRVLGDSTFDEKLASRRAGFLQLEAGELGRTLYSATASRSAS